MEYTEKRAYLELHLAVFLWGFTAILGDWIALAALPLVWWRVFLTGGSLLPFVRVGRLAADWGWRYLLQLAGVGVLVGLHWVCFYGSIKLANASVALVCMATTSLFSALIEPWIVGRKFEWIELLLGIFILPGIVLIAGQLDGRMTDGLWVGLAAAFFAALFTSLNKRLTEAHDPIRVTFVEMTAATLVLPIFFLWGEPIRFWPWSQDWGLLIVLALVCTTFTFVLALRALKQLSAFATNLTINLEPIYGMVLAYFLLDDAQELDGRFYLGAVLILLGVFSYPLIKKYRSGRTSSSPSER